MSRYSLDHEEETAQEHEGKGLVCDCCSWTGPAEAFLVQRPDDSDPAFQTVRCLDEAACLRRLIGRQAADVGQTEPLPF